MPDSNGGQKPKARGLCPFMKETCIEASCELFEAKPNRCCLPLISWNTFKGANPRKAAASQ